MLTELERQQHAQELFQAALQHLAQEFGMTVEPVLHMEPVRPDYATARAIFQLRPITGWQPIVRPPEPLK